ncbi:hypothetical protein SHPE106448_20850 [Shewanella pealeana]
MQERWDDARRKVGILLHLEAKSTDVNSRSGAIYDL